MQVTISFPNHQEQEVLLAGVPRIGERIRLRNGGDTTTLVVHDILWVEVDERGEPPTVIAFVRRTK